MKGLPYIDIDKASEYLSIASAILEIKAKSLVPAIVEPESEEEDGEAMLIRALEEYKMLKEESAKLKELETVGFFDTRTAIFLKFRTQQRVIARVQFGQLQAVLFAQ